MHMPQANGSLELKKCKGTLKSGCGGSTATSKLAAELGVFETVTCCGEVVCVSE